MPRTAADNVRVYDPLHREAAQVWNDRVEGKCALFQRRLPNGDIQYEAHYLSARAIAFLEDLSFAQRDLRRFNLGV